MQTLSVIYVNQLSNLVLDTNTTLHFAAKHLSSQWSAGITPVPEPVLGCQPIQQSSTAKAN